MTARNKIRAKLRKLSSSQRGSVMMEYIILNLFIMAVLVAGQHFFFPADDSYGTLGDAYLQRFHLMQRIVSMPFP